MDTTIDLKRIEFSSKKSKLSGKNKAQYAHTLYLQYNDTHDQCCRSTKVDLNILDIFI